MALDSNEAIVVSGGNVYLAPVGTAMPTDMLTPTTPWENIGYLEESGPAPTGFSRDKTSLYAWNTDTPLRTSYAAAEPSIDFTLLQFTEDTLALYFGGGTYTTGTPPAPHSYTAPDASMPQEHAMILDWFDGDSSYRWCVPKVSVAASGDITLTREAFMQMPVSASILSTGTAPPFTLLWTPGAGALAAASSRTSAPSAAAA